MPVSPTETKLILTLTVVESYPQAPKDPDHCVREGNREDFHEAKLEGQDWYQGLDHYHTHWGGSHKEGDWEGERDFQSGAFKLIYIKHTVPYWRTEFT